MKYLRREKGALFADYRQKEGKARGNRNLRAESHPVHLPLPPSPSFQYAPLHAHGIAQLAEEKGQQHVDRLARLRRQIIALVRLGPRMRLVELPQLLQRR